MRTQESKKLVALNYQKFHSIKTHTSRGHKKWMSIIKTVFSDAFFYILGGFLCRFFFFFCFLHPLEPALFHFRFYAKLIEPNYGNWMRRIRSS